METLESGYFHNKNLLQMSSTLSNGVPAKIKLNK